MIWCVEDDSSIRDVEVYTLRSTGFEARGFADGTAFWSAIGTARELPELVVLDVMLPGVDGVELLRRLAASRADLHTLATDTACDPGRLTRLLRELLERGKIAADKTGILKINE